MRDKYSSFRWEHIDYLIAKKRTTIKFKQKNTNLVFFKNKIILLSGLYGK